MKKLYQTQKQKRNRERQSRRAFRNKLRTSSSTPKRKLVLFAKSLYSRILEAYAEQTVGIPKTDSWRRERKEKIVDVNFPSTFSFIEDPESALAALEKLMESYLHRNASRIGINQTECSTIDYGAMAVACALAKAASSGAGITHWGSYPVDLASKMIVAAAGFPKVLNARPPEIPHFLRFDLFPGRTGLSRVRRGQDELGSTDREIVTSALVSYFDTCLSRNGFGLTGTGKQLIAPMVGEVIENAEYHSEMGYWWVGGYLCQDQDADYGDCHVAIFNLGCSMADSISTLPHSSRLRRDIDNATDKILQRLPRSSSLSPEEIHTVFALQEGVSKFNTDPVSIGMRGTGTVSLIDFFQKLGRAGDEGPEPKMCLLSGNSHITFDDSYQMKSELRSGEYRKIIAFNVENDLSKPPDPQKVRRLKRRFPGTIISMRFYISPEHLAKLSTD